MRQKFTYLFIFLFLTSVGSFSFAQNVLVDFEEGGNGAAWSWTTFGNTPDVPPSVILNPDMSGLNTSDSVLQFTALFGQQEWAGFFSDDIGTFTFDETNSTVTIMVWKPTISDVGVKFETPGVNEIEIKIPNTVTNAWEELTYDFSGQIGNTFNRLTILPDFGPRTQDNTLYLDNLTIPEGTVAADVTFQVDMNLISSDDFDPLSNVVSIRGSFNDWGETPMVDDSSNGKYSVTLALNAGTYYYKFYHNGGTGGATWEDSKFDGNDGNRQLVVETSDLSVAYFFNEIGAYTGIQTEVEFNADMRLPIKQGNVIPGETNVFVAGSFTDWQNGAFPMLDDDGDSVYTVIADSILSGDIVAYKYVYSSDSAAAGTWESVPDRKYGVRDTGNVVSHFWDDENPNITLADGDIGFTLDMSVMEELGLFDPNTDSTQLRGSFNGWSDGDATISKLNQDFLDPNTWFLTIPFDNGVVGSEQFYKYFVTFADTNKGNIWSDGYERPLTQGGGNRDAIFDGVFGQVTERKFYDDVLPAYVILEDGIEITFSVDMTDAANADLQVPTFNPAADEVYWISEQPAFVYSQGWEDSDTMKVLQLTDQDGDMVYEGTLTVTAPAWNGFSYRYTFVQENQFTTESGGFGDFAYRVRYIEQAGYRKFVQPYAAPTDSWLGEQEDKSSQSETGPAGDITGVKDLSLVANKFSLEQNYPNPFNPTTQIRFSIPATDIVTLKIYNVLGQEVKTLINEELKAGSYEFNFNASNLASGLYVYALTSGNFVSNKKMMLLK